MARPSSDDPLSNQRSVTIRRAEASDAESISMVRARAVVASDAYPEITNAEAESLRFLPRVRGYLEGSYHPGSSLPERAAFVAREGSEPIGFIAGQLSTRMGCQGELQWMFVLPECQRRGIGGRLLVPMAEWFLEHEALHVIIDAPPDNPDRAFYLRHGAEALDEYWLHWPDVSVVSAGEP